MHVKNIKIVARFCVLVVALFANVSIFSQTIGEPNLNVSTACPNDGLTPFNEYTIAANITGGLFPVGATFTLQLSNKNGSFPDGGTVNITSTTATGETISFVDFAFPEVDASGDTLGSETYRLRILVDGTSEVSQRSKSFKAYYFDGRKFVLLPSNALCEIGGTLTAENDLDRYLWYKDDVIIPGENESMFTPTSTGSYYYTPDFGSCNPFLDDDIRSNVVKVLNTTPIPISITNVGPTVICAKDSVVLESDLTDPNLAYQWVKDGLILPGETGTSITVSGITAEGNYRIEVADSSTSLSDRCTSQSNEIFVDLLNPSIKIISPLMVVDIPGQDEILSVEVSSGSPVVTWFKDGVEIENSNTTSLVATGLGVYTAKVVDDTTTCDIKEVFTENEIQVLPISNLTFSITASDDQVSDCILESVDLSVSDIRVFGATDAVPIESISGLDFIWYRNDTVVEGESDEIIRLSELANNGSYRAEIDVNGTIFDSDNTIDVQLNLESLNISQDPEELTIGGSVDLILELPLDIPVSEFAIQWIRGANFEIPGETSERLTITNPGSYSARVSLSGCTTQVVGPINVQSGSAVIPNVLSRDIDALNNDWIIPTQLSLDPEIKVEIYTNSGQLDYTSEGDLEGYSDQWPSESKSQLKESIYYYVISKNNNPVEKGSITIIR